MVKEPDLEFNNTFTENIPVWVILLEWLEHCYINIESTSFMKLCEFWFSLV